MSEQPANDLSKELTGEWDYSTLPGTIRIGEGCWLERRASFDRFRSEFNPGLVLAKRVKAFTWSTFNIEPTGLVEIGDDCILVGLVFMCHEHIKIGNRVKISYHVTIADADFHPIDPRARRQDSIASRPNGDPSDRPPFISQPIVIADDVDIGIGRGQDREAWNSLASVFVISADTLGLVSGDTSKRSIAKDGTSSSSS